MSWYPSRLLVIVWLALLALLALTTFLAFMPLGPLNLPVSVVIAAIKALLVAAIFMELRERGGIVIAFAVAGVFWLGVLIWLSGTDYVTRLGFPPGQ